MPRKTTTPKPTERDLKIVEAIYTHEGVLSDYQINYLFFKTIPRTVEQRLERLMAEEYLSTLADKADRAYVRYLVYFVGKKGREYLAELYKQPDLKIRASGGRLHLTRHDLAVNDFRIAMTEAVATHPELTLTQWIPSTEFWRDYDTVTFSLKRDKRTHNKSQGVRPDSYFVIQQPGTLPSRFLLELDRATEDHPRFAREKLHAGLAYIKSEAYKARFGFNAGRWLVVTTSETRRKNMQELATRELGRAAETYYFTTWDQVISLEYVKYKSHRVEYHDVLSAPIWFKGAAETPTVLFESYIRKPR